MPAYSFKERFCPWVIEGSKTHTVRDLRKGRQGHAKPGDTVYLYYGMRTKYCRKLGEGICTKVENITISSDSITIDGRKLSWDEMIRFAWKDGFRAEGTTENEPGDAWTAMRRFWKENHGLDAEHPWMGVVIHWQLKSQSEWKTAK